MKSFFALLSLCLVFASCCPCKKAASTNEMNQGVTGFVTEVTGNQMPGPGAKLPPPKPVKTTIYVHEATDLSQVEQTGSSPFYSAIKTKLVKTVESDAEGRFRLTLMPGVYSLFVKVDGKYYSNSFDSKNIIGPASVEANKFTEVNILISDKAVF